MVLERRGEIKPPKTLNRNPSFSFSKWWRAPGSLGGIAREVQGVWIAPGDTHGLLENEPHITWGVCVCVEHSHLQDELCSTSTS